MDKSKPPTRAARGDTPTPPAAATTEPGVKLTPILESFEGPLAELMRQRDFHLARHETQLAEDFERSIAGLRALRDGIRMLCRAERCPANLPL